MKKFILGIFIGVVIAVGAVLYVQQEQTQQSEVKNQTEVLNKFRRNKAQTREDLNRQMQNKLAVAANNFMQAQTPQDMLKSIDEIITMRPQDPNLYLLKAQLLKDQGNLKAALAEINKAISLDPQNPNYYQVRGEIEFAGKDFEKAERDFTAAAQLSGKADNYYNRAITNLNLGNYQAANIDFKRAQKLYRKEGNLSASNQARDISRLITQNIPTASQPQQKVNKPSGQKTENTQQNNVAVNELIKAKMPNALKHYSESETLKEFKDFLPQIDDVKKEANAVKTKVAQETVEVQQPNYDQQSNGGFQNNPAPQYNSAPQAGPTPRKNYESKNNAATQPQNNLQPSSREPQSDSPQEEPQEAFGPQENYLPEAEQQRKNQSGLTQQQNVEMPKITKRDIFKNTPLASIHKAENLMGNKDYDGAKAVLDSAIEKFPNSDSLYLNRAKANYLQGNYQGAISDLDKALEINPNNYNAAISKGDLYGSLGQNTEAKNAYKEAAQIAANNDDRKGVNEAQTKYQLAAGQEITAKADERFAKAANAYTNKDYDTAVSIFSDIYKENPTPENAFNLGLAYKGQGNAQEAYKMLSFTADNKQENFEAQMLAAQTAAEQPLEDYQNAVKYLDRAKNIANKTGIVNPDMWALSAQINSNLGDHETARADLKNALEGYNEQMATITDREERQRIEEQIKQIEEYLQQFENN